MKKLKLALESLEVVSFEAVSSERRARGTVIGNSQLQPVQFSEAPFQCPETGPGCDYTLALSCIPDNCYSDGQVLCRITEGADCA